MIAREWKKVMKEKTSMKLKLNKPLNTNDQRQIHFFELKRGNYSREILRCKAKNK